MTFPKVKICCISSQIEAQLAIQYGASAIGLVGNMPSGPGIIDDQLINKIAKVTPPYIATFLLTSETAAERIIDHHKLAQTTTIQIVDTIENNDYALIRHKLPNVKLIQVIHVIDEDSIHQAKQVSAHVDAVLLDSGNPNLKTKELGGTGRTHNWLLSKKIRESVDIPVWLAGGLNASNIQEAIKMVQPYGVDLCSGVRTDGQLDEEKLKKVFDGVYTHL